VFVFCARVVGRRFVVFVARDLGRLLRPATIGDSNLAETEHEDNESRVRSHRP